MRESWVQSFCFASNPTPPPASSFLDLRSDLPVSSDLSHLCWLLQHPHFQIYPIRRQKTEIGVASRQTRGSGIWSPSYRLLRRPHCTSELSDGAFYASPIWWIHSNSCVCRQCWCPTEPLWRVPIWILAPDLFWEMSECCFFRWEPLR